MRIRSVQLVVQVLNYVWQHPSNRGARASAVARALRFQLRGRLGRKTIVRIGEMRMWGVLHHAASSKVAYANPPDLPEMMAWKKRLRSGSLFVDVGSNVGAYTLWALGSGANVIAVEPSEKAVRILRENLALNGSPAVEIHTCALVDRPGEVFFTEGLDTTNHVIAEDGGGRVEAKTLDTVLAGRMADGVKIDVEGAERLVLEGGRDSLACGRIRALQLEWNSQSEVVLEENRQPILELLSAYGYKFFRPTLDGTLRPVDPKGYGADVFAIAP